MTSEAGANGARLERWCGTVLAGLAVLTPLVAWGGPLGFAALVALTGLLCLPAARILPRQRPVAIVILILVTWAAISTFWSPFRPSGVDDSTALKLGLQAPLYWSAWQAAQRVTPSGRRRALRLFAWGLAGLGALLLVEAFTDAALYRGLRELLNDPIRPDLARKNVAQASFVLALLWPIALAGGLRAGTPVWLGLPMAAGVALLAQIFLSDAPVLAVGLSILAGSVVWSWPRRGPLILAAVASGGVLSMPLIVTAIRISGMAEGLPESWAQRVAYWSFARARIAEHPWRGWGLDASRTFSPNIQLHPHNGSLQIWLELGMLGAVLAAFLWILLFRRLSGHDRSIVAVGAAASATVYLLFGLISFGVWQEWWLASGTIAAIITTLAAAERPRTV